MRGWLIGCVVVGVIFRAVLMAASGWRIEYDEAMVGLMAAEILDGERPVFLAAQPTLGMLEGYMLAGVYTVVGVNRVALRVLSLLYSAGYIAGVGTLARLGFGRRVGALAALLAAVSPLYLVAVGTKIWAGTMGTLTFGTWLLCLAGGLLQAQTPPRRRLVLWGLVGLTAGVMFWTAFLSAYYLLPVALILGGYLLGQLWRGRGRAALAGVGLALVGFAIGSAPFWLYNLHNDWITLTLALGNDPSTPQQLRAIADHFLRDLIPRLASGDPNWGGLGTTARITAAGLYGIGIAVLMGRALWRVRQTGSGARLLTMGVALAVPFIYVNTGFARNALNPFGVDATGRYVLMWHTVMPIGVAVLAVWVSRWRQFVGAGVVAVILTLNLLGAFTVNPVRLFDSPYYDRLPPDLTPIIDTLDAAQVRYVWTDVAIAHPLIFETNERILAADYYDTEIAGGLLRFPAYYAAVEEATRRGEAIAYIYPVRPEDEAPPIEQALDASGVAYHIEQINGVRVYFPAEPIHPSELAAGLGYQY